MPLCPSRKDSQTSQMAPAAEATAFGEASSAAVRVMATAQAPLASEARVGSKSSDAFGLIRISFDHAEALRIFRKIWSYCTKSASVPKRPGSWVRREAQA